MIAPGLAKPLRQTDPASGWFVRYPARIVVPVIVGRRDDRRNGAGRARTAGLAIALALRRPRRQGRGVKPADSSRALTPLLPASAGAALLRGMRGICPRCGQARLFRRWLKPLDRCTACAVDWTPQQADDFPAYISILLTGHLLAPLIIVLVRDWDLGAGALAATILPLTVILMLGLLQPAKGAVIALQWWHGLNGFVRERGPS